MHPTIKPVTAKAARTSFYPHGDGNMLMIHMPPPD
jgi:hypothetical protein